jgi:hypothetical protein
VEQLLGDSDSLSLQVGSQRMRQSFKMHLPETEFHGQHAFDGPLMNVELLHNGLLAFRLCHRSITQSVLTIIVKSFPHGHNNDTL